MFPSTSLLSAISQPFKRSQLGLFQGKTKQSGNNVPFSKKKTRRTWLPNVQNKQFVSDILGKKVEIKVTVRALRSIRKAGGVDNYLLKSKADVLGWEGLRLRNEILQKQRDDRLTAEFERRFDNLDQYDGIFHPDQDPLVKHMRNQDAVEYRLVNNLSAEVVKPSMDGARLARSLMGHVAGNSEPLSATETIQLLKKFRPKLNGLDIRPAA